MAFTKQKRALLAFALIIALTGCSYIQQAVDRGADASKEAHDAAERTICRILPVGTVKDIYKTAEEIATYNAFCGDTLPVEPEPEASE